jgi:hypothetical protein
MVSHSWVIRSIVHWVSKWWSILTSARMGEGRFSWMLSAFWCIPLCQCRLCFEGKLVGVGCMTWND